MRKRIYAQALIKINQQASAVSYIETQNNSDLGDQTNVTHAGDQFAKANKKKEGMNEN
jgi:hypothetical protein